MRRVVALHLLYPFAGSRMLRGLLIGEGKSVGRRHVETAGKLFVAGHFLTLIIGEASSHHWWYSGEGFGEALESGPGPAVFHFGNYGIAALAFNQRAYGTGIPRTDLAPGS